MDILYRAVGCRGARGPGHPRHDFVSIIKLKTNGLTNLNTEDEVNITIKYNNNNNN